VSQGSELSRNMPPERMQALVEAMAHPVRAKLLIAVTDKSEAGVSVRQLAERIKEPPRRVRYHLDAMVDLGLVSIVSRRCRRNVVERFYRAEQLLLVPTDVLDGPSEEQARQMSMQILKVIVADASLAVGAKIFGLRSGHVVARLPGEVDEQGWSELSSLQDQALHRSQAVIKASRERLRASGDPAIPALVALLMFEVPPWPLA
jgi:DNA-binding transcriptional ArsR family regulator